MTFLPSNRHDALGRFLPEMLRHTFRESLISKSPVQLARKLGFFLGDGRFAEELFREFFPAPFYNDI